MWNIQQHLRKFLRNSVQFPLLKDTETSCSTQAKSIHEVVEDILQQKTNQSVSFKD